MLRRTLGTVLPCLVLVPFVTACGGAGSSGAIEVPSRTASFSPTRERPTPTRTPDEPDTSAPAPSSAPNPGPSSGPPSAPPTRTRATVTQTATSSVPAAPSSSPEESPSTAPAESGTGDDENSNDNWWWLLVAGVVVAAVVGLLLLRSARSRRAWEARLATAEREVGWFARDLIPQLRGSGSLAGVSGGWTVASPRVAVLDDRLSELITTAPGDERRARASALQEAVRTARDRVVAVAGAGEAAAQWALDLDEAQAPLLAVLVPPPTSGDGDPSAR